MKLTTGLTDSAKRYYMQKNAGHYGVFNGGKWRREIAPRIKAFIREYDRETGSERDRIIAVNPPRRRRTDRAIPQAAE